jgi:hypothetical protein
MKVFLQSLFISVFILLIARNGLAQCETDALNELSISEIQGKGFTFVKSYKVDGQGGAKQKVEYSYVFSKDTKYLFSINGKDDKSQGIILTIFDGNRKEVISNFDRVNNKFYHMFELQCKATGIYYMTFTFNNSKSYCAATVIGFRR